MKYNILPKDKKQQFLYGITSFISEILSDHRLHLPEYKVLLLFSQYCSGKDKDGLYTTMALPLSFIARNTGMSKYAVSRTVDRLERLGRIKKILPISYYSLKKQYLDLLVAEQDWLCNGCRREISQKEATLDHIYPKSRGGTDHELNLQALCFSCNASKNNKTMAEWKGQR